MLDDTEEIRRDMLGAQQVQGPLDREQLIARYNCDVYDSDELREQFEVIGFLAPFCVVRRTRRWPQGLVGVPASSPLLLQLRGRLRRCTMSSYAETCCPACGNHDWDGPLCKTCKVDLRKTVRRRREKMHVDPVRLMTTLHEQAEKLKDDMMGSEHLMIQQANYTASLVLISLASAVGRAMVADIQADAACQTPATSTTSSTNGDSPSSS